MRKPRPVVSRGVAVAVGILLLGCDSSPAPEGRLRILTPGVPDHLDPARDSRLGSRNVYVNVFEPLARIDAQGRFGPGLAESWSNPVPEIYSFRLRSGTRFQDGELLDASLVVASLRRAQDPASVVAGSLAEAVDIRALDARTVEIRTRRPTAVLLPALTAVLIEKPARDGRPVGTGPFEVVEFQPGEQVRLRRFRGHRGPRPILDEVVIRRYRDEAHLRALLNDPESTAVVDPPPSVVEAARSDPRFRVVAESTGSLVYLAFNLRDSAPLPEGIPRNPFRDRRVRRAFHLALDLHALIREAAPHGGQVATQHVPPGVFGFDGARPEPVRDLARAHALLAEAGFPRGFRSPLDVRSNDRPLAESLARQLAAAGVQLEPRLLSSQELLRRRTSGETLLCAYNWVVGEDSGLALRSFLHTSDPERRLGLRNFTGYSNPKVDLGLDEALATVDDVRRAELLRGVIGVLMEDLPWLPLFADKTARIYPSGLGFPARLDGTLVLSDATPIGP